MIPTSNKFDLELEKDQWIQDNKHICLIPYTETQYQRHQKNPCCFYKFNRPPMGTSKDINHNVIEIKKNVETGQVDKNCKFCHDQEDAGQLSARSRSLLSFTKNLTAHDIREGISTKKFNEHTDFFMFSNKCNMACRICNGGTSSLYYSTWNNKKNNNNHVTLSDNLSYWNSIKSDIRHNIEHSEIYRITVSGGEGTIQEDLYKLTDWLIEENLNDKVNLQISTNGSVFLDKVFDNWCRKFKSLSFGISVDSAHPDNFQYVRYPVKFEKIHENLKRFSELAKTHSNCSFYITPTFYINNIVYLEDFLDYFEEVNVPVWDNTLSQPKDLCLSTLPLAVREKVIDQISLLIDHKFLNISYNYNFKLSIENIITQLRESKFDDNIWKNYLSTTARWDKLTNTDISLHNQKLWDLLSESDRTLYYQYKNDLNN